jgi:gamma-butyrobetaine dioxygenase
VTIMERGSTEIAEVTVRLDVHGRTVEAPPLWLLACSTEPFDLDPSSCQRLFDPAEADPDLRIVAQRMVSGVLHVDFSDGRTRRFDPHELTRRALQADPEALPDPVPWATLKEVPTIDWADVEAGGTACLRRVLGDFHRLGCFTVHGAPTEPGSLHAIAGRFGRVSATNFGTLFDVESLPQPVDLAYSAVGLAAHTDQPYRRPTPALQFLHTLCNDAPGGESTIADGVAGSEALRRADPDGYAALCDVDVEFRYDVGADVVVHRATVIELDRHGVLRQLRFSPRVDSPPLTDPVVLSAWFRARRWLSEWFADSAHHVEFKMVAGDVLVVDNHRVLHGRRPFDPSVGRRHLQGCYIDHDGPATMWRMLTRQLGEHGATG